MAHDKMSYWVEKYKPFVIFLTRKSHSTCVHSYLIFSLKAHKQKKNNISLCILFIGKTLGYFNPMTQITNLIVFLIIINIFFWFFKCFGTTTTLHLRDHDGQLQRLNPFWQIIKYLFRPIVIKNLIYATNHIQEYSI